MLKLDVDSPRCPKLVGRVGFLARLWRLTVRAISWQRTRRGWHCEIVVSQAVAPVVQVAMQAILGSDPAREAFNLVRARKLARVPALWRRRFNVLYGDKL